MTSPQSISGALGLSSSSAQQSHPSNQEDRKTIPFLTFPAEIRNSIYRWTFILSRVWPSEYNIPDFVVHGNVNSCQHSSTQGGIRWANIKSFPLLLTNKQIFLEALPIISAESYMEIKIYTDDRVKRREKKAYAAYSTLLRTKALCQDVRKVILNLTPTDYTVDFCLDYGVDPQITRLASLLQTYQKLKELTLVIRTGSLIMNSSNWELLGESFFVMAKKKRQGVSLCVELVDYFVDFDDSDISEGETDMIVEERNLAEKMFDNAVERYSGKGADVSYLIIILSRC
jgi:hypothetical protein